MTRRLLFSRAAALLAALCIGAGTTWAFADDQDLDLAIATTKTPAEWKKVEPKSRIVQFEYAAPKAEGADADGRVTIMAAGGGVKANVDRWYGQFTQPDGKATKDVSKTEKKEIDGLEVHIVDIPGTFAESTGGPFAGKTVERPDYRMLGAIIVSKEAEIYIKLTGPAKTVAAHEKGFKKMVEDLKKKKLAPPTEF